MSNIRYLITLMMILCPVSATAVTAQPPNILFLLTDDQRHDALHGAGNKLIHTPHLDALAHEGIRFSNMFVTTAICSTSRASILTGLYERTHGYSFGTKPVSSEHARSSYPALLKKAGCHTGFVGKWGVTVEKGITSELFDSMVPLNQSPYWKKFPDGKRRHLTDMEGDHAMAFLKSLPPGKPFCLSVSFNAPHAEDNDPQQYHWQQEVDHLYQTATFPVPRTMNDEFFQKHPAFLKNSESRVRFHWRFDQPDKYQNMVRGYYRMISGVDLVVGRIRQSLKSLGFADNTIIIFTSDNGYFLGERGFADKWYLYEPSVRVPLIVFDPRSPRTLQGSVQSAMALNVDLAPTILQLAGVPVPKTMQGKSLKPLLQGTVPDDWRTEFFYEHLFKRHNIPMSEGVRTNQYTYIRWFQQKPVVEELYDHQADPDQVNNLIHQPPYQLQAAQLRQKADAYCKQWSNSP